MEHYSAIDPCPDSRAVILAKRPGQRPQHFFESILDRVPQETLKALLGMQVSLRERVIQQVQEATSEGGTEQGKAARVHFVKAFGQHFAAEAQQILSASEMVEESWCFVCLGVCSARPPREEGALLIEVAGSICDPYSRMNQHPWGLLDPQSLPMLVWAEWCCRWRPDVVLHENVLPFPTEVPNSILTQERQTHGVIFNEADVLESSPRQFGVPKTRFR